MSSSLERPWPAGVATGIGSLPGDDVREALRVAAGEVPEFPFLPELPGRGAPADLVGRGVALLAELHVDYQPAGWRLTSGSSHAEQQAKALLGNDLDTLEEVLGNHRGALKVQVPGPWTLAATVERPRGDRVLADHGARRELAESLAEGIAAHVAVVRRRVPGARVVVQVDELALPHVLAGDIPTSSGFSRHRPVEAVVAERALAGVLAAVVAAGATPVVHCCAADVPVGLLVRAGAVALSVDVETMAVERLDAYAEAVENGLDLFAGVVPAVAPAGPVDDVEPTRRLLRWWADLGFPAGSCADRCVVTPTCGLAGASPGWARDALGLATRVAHALTDPELPDAPAGARGRPGGR